MSDEEKGNKNNNLNNSNDNETKVKFEVDVWASDLHAEEIGVFKDARRAFKDRQWTEGSEIFGMVQKDGEEYGPLSYKEDKWNTDDPMNRRLVIKSFTPSNYWRGTIELQEGRSVAISHAANEPVPVFLVNIDGEDYVVRLHKVPHKRAFRGDTWSFDLLFEDGVVRSYMIDDNRFTLGNDFYIKDIHNNLVGEIDGKFLNIGGKYEISIYHEDLAKEKLFYQTIILFAAVIEFLDEIENNIKKIIKNIRGGKELKLDHHEQEFYLNPRRRQK